MVAVATTCTGQPHPVHDQRRGRVSRSAAAPATRPGRCRARRRGRRGRPGDTRVRVRDDRRDGQHHERHVHGTVQPADQEHQDHHAHGGQGPAEAAQVDGEEGALAGVADQQPDRQPDGGDHRGQQRVLEVFERRGRRRPGRTTAAVGQPAQHVGEEFTLPTTPPGPRGEHLLGDTRTRSATSANSRVSTTPAMTGTAKSRWNPSMNSWPSAPWPMNPATLTRLIVITVATRTPATITGRASGSST